MPGKSITPEQLTEAVILRAAGYSIVGISGRVGVSVSTLQRAFKTHGARKGAAKIELIEAAKKQLMRRVTDDEAIREEAARLIADDLAHALMLRERMAVAAEQLKATNLIEAALMMRAAAAYSVALKNTSDVIRHTMRLDKALPEPDAETPELVVRVISDEEAARMRPEAATGAGDAILTDS